MPVLTLPDVGSFQPPLLRDGVRMCGLLRTMHTVLRKAGRQRMDLVVQVAPDQEGPIFFKHPTEDLTAHQQMHLAHIGGRAQALWDRIVQRLLAHPANADGWFRPRFALNYESLQPALYVPGYKPESRLAVHLNTPGDLGRALALSDLVLAQASDGPRKLYAETRRYHMMTGVGVWAADEDTALMLAWAWRHPTELARALSGHTTLRFTTHVERRYDAQNWLENRRLRTQQDG